jgi:hypothetical protein
MVGAASQLCRWDNLLGKYIRWILIATRLTEPQLIWPLTLIDFCAFFYKAKGLKILWCIDPLLCNRQINKRPFLDNGFVNTPMIIEELLKAEFSLWSAPKLYNGDPRPVEELREFS